MNEIYEQAEDLYDDEKDDAAILLIESVNYQENIDLLLLYSEILLNPSKGNPKKKNIQTGITLLEKSLELGSADAAYELGQIYAYYDDLVKEDQEKAEEYWKQGFELRSGLCAVELLDYYDMTKMNNFEYQIVLAESLLEDDVLCKIGYASLGKIFLNPEYTKRNIEKGITNYACACVIGSVNSCMKLMHFYYTGELVEKDLKVSYEYCLKGEQADKDDLFKSEIKFWKTKLESEM